MAFARGARGRGRPFCTPCQVGAREGGRATATGSADSVSGSDQRQAPVRGPPRQVPNPPPAARPQVSAISVSEQRQGQRSAARRRGRRLPPGPGSPPPAARPPSSGPGSFALPPVVDAGVPARIRGRLLRASRSRSSRGARCRKARGCGGDAAPTTRIRGDCGPPPVPRILRPFTRAQNAGFAGTCAPTLHRGAPPGFVDTQVRPQAGSARGRVGEHGPLNPGSGPRAAGGRGRGRGASRAGLPLPLPLTLPLTLPLPLTLSLRPGSGVRAAGGGEPGSGPEARRASACRCPCP